jgi:hypothetical protein
LLSPNLLPKNFDSSKGALLSDVLRLRQGAATSVGLALWIDGARPKTLPLSLHIWRKL